MIFRSEEIPGKLTDHYDPKKRALFLSSPNFNERSLSAVGVAAHEAGHALAATGGLRAAEFAMAIVPVTNFASQLLILFYWAASFSIRCGHLSGPMFSHMMTLRHPVYLLSLRCFKS